MRISLLVSVVVIALALGACGEDTNKNPTTPKTFSTTATTTTPPVAADNSGRNARDDGTAVTPLDQGISEKDLAITQSVRKAVVDHKGLSINGQNVKIITKDGMVTLRGPVDSEAERSTIVGMVEKTPDVRSVINHLEVAAR